MAVTENRRMQQLKGKYADLDKSKMLVGEIAVPSDHAPIMKIDTNKFIELMTSEDTEYIEKVTENLNNALADVEQLAIDKVGINDTAESSVQTYSSRKIEEMHNAQEQAFANQFKTATGTEILATDTSKGYVTDFSMEGKSEQNGTPTPTNPIAILNSGDCVEMMQGLYGGGDGVWITSTNYVCTKYPIPCVGGDVVVVNFETNFTDCIIVFYDNNGFLKGTHIATTNLYTATVTVPSGATHFNLDFKLANVTPDTAGKIELTINGKYVLQVKSVNKNLLDTPKNVSGTLDSNGQISTGTTSYTSDFIKVSGDTTLSLQSYTAETWLRIGLYDTNKNFISRSIVQATDTVKSLTVNHNGFIRVSYEVYAVDVQVELNSTATNYVPHTEHMSTILLNEPLRAVNDVKDIIEYVDNGYKVRRKIGSVVFNGDEDLHLDSTGFMYTTIDDIKTVALSEKANIICSHYITSSRNELTSNDYAVSTGTSKGFISFYNKDVSSLDEWKALLASNPITVQYEMAEEVIEDIADQTPFYQIQTYDGGTTISTTDRLQPTFSVEYPTNRTAGVASEGFIKGNLANIKADKLEKTMLALSTALV